MRLKVKSSVGGDSSKLCLHLKREKITQLLQDLQENIKIISIYSIYENAIKTVWLSTLMYLL